MGILHHSGSFCGHQHIVILRMERIFLLGLLYLLLLQSTAHTSPVEEKEFEFGNGEKLTLGFDTDVSSVKREEDDIPDYTQHDCNTIRPFHVDNLVMEDWIVNGRNFKTKNTFVKYNHAYGIPILGRDYFTDDSMRRACYLV